jgi:hypothetical protein
VCALNGVKLVQEVCPGTDYTFTFGAHVLGRSKDKNVATSAASELERGPPLMYWAFQGTNSCLKDLAGIVFRLPASVCSGARTSNVMRGAVHTTKNRNAMAEQKRSMVAVIKFNTQQLARTGKAADRSSSIRSVVMLQSLALGRAGHYSLLGQQPDCNNDLAQDEIVEADGDDDDDTADCVEVTDQVDEVVPRKRRRLDLADDDDGDDGDGDIEDDVTTSTCAVCSNQAKNVFHKCLLCKQTVHNLCSQQVTKSFGGDKSEGVMACRRCFVANPSAFSPS